MASINYANREILIKIVYYGPGMSGKTTNLQVIHQNVPQQSKGNLISLATEADRTLFFDLLPLSLGEVKGFNTKFQLYTVPGQVYYNTTRRLVLKGVDGVVFVADSQQGKMDDNIESLNNLRENLNEYGLDASIFPIVLQYNKRDLPNLYSLEELNAALNPMNSPFFEAAAVKNQGVFETLKAISRETLNRINRQPPSRPAGTMIGETSTGDTGFGGRPMLPEPAPVAGFGATDGSAMTPAADPFAAAAAAPAPAQMAERPSVTRAPVPTPTAPPAPAPAARPARATPSLATKATERPQPVAPPPPVQKSFFQKLLDFILRRN